MSRANDDGSSKADPGSAMDLLREVGAVLEGHFQYASGRHGSLYVEKFRLLEDPAATTRLCGMLAEHFADYQDKRASVVDVPGKAPDKKVG